MENFLTYVIFVLTASIPVLAVIGELHHRTPTSISYSIVRSFICFGSLFFMSEILNPAYHVKISHLIMIGFIFFASIFQLYLEIHDETIDEILKRHSETN